MAALAFLRPFGLSSDLAFGADVRGVALALHLPPPIPAVQVQAIPPPLVRIELALSLAQPAVTMQVSRVHLATLLDAAQPASFAGALAFSADIPTAVVSTSGTRWHDGASTLQAALSVNTTALPVQQAAAVRWQQAAAGGVTLDSAWQQGEPLPGVIAHYWRHAVALLGHDVVVWQEGEPQRAGRVERFRDASALRDAWAERFQEGDPLRDTGSTRWRDALRVDIARMDGYGDGLHLGVTTVEVWQQATYPWWVRPPTPKPPEPPDPIFNSDIEFLFPFLLTADIEFVRQGPRRIPLRRTYFVLHEIAITRVSDGAELHFEDLTLSADVGSWGWSLSGNALGDATYARLVASPFTEIDVLINGLHWRFLVTSVRHSRRFGSTGYSVTGVSPALALTAPLSDARSRRITAPWTLHQLADQEVENTAWAVSWNAPDWLIPGGVWQYSQQTPLQAIGSLAEAAGAFVQADATQRTILVQPRYPAWPWSDDWLFQSLTVPTAILWDLTRSPKPGNNYNAVYAAGTVSGGIMGYVRRAGSAGDIQPGAPITNTLITHVDGARAFGGSYLADHLDQADVSFSMILGGDAPLIGLASRIDLTEPGQDPQRLLTQAVSISVQRGNNAVTVTQGVKGVLWLS